MIQADCTLIRNRASGTTHAPPRPGQTRAGYRTVPDALCGCSIWGECEPVQREDLFDEAPPGPSCKACRRIIERESVEEQARELVKVWSDGYLHVGEGGPFSKVLARAVARRILEVSK